MSPTIVDKIFSQFLPKRPTQTIFDLGPKERFNMIREVHHVHQKSWKKHSKKMSKRSHQKRSACSLAPSSRHYLPEYTKQEISQSVYNIIVPCIIFSCYLIPKIIQEMLQNSVLGFVSRVIFVWAVIPSISKEYVVPLFMTPEEFKAYKNVVNYKVL